MRRQVAGVLQSGGFEIVEARDGFEALARLDSDPAFSAVLCNVNMPRLNGLDLLDRLVANGRLPQLPVVMLTTEVEAGMIQRAKDAGAKGWIVKPCLPSILLAVMQGVAGV